MADAEKNSEGSQAPQEDVQTSAPQPAGNVTPPAKPISSDSIPNFYKYKPEVTEHIKHALENGATRLAAGTSARINMDTFYRWMKLIPEFEEMVVAAENVARTFVESQLWKNVKAGKGPDIRYYLETRGGEEWKGNGILFKQDIHVGASKDGRVSVASRVSALPDKDLDEILRGAQSITEQEEGHAGTDRRF